MSIIQQKLQEATAEFQTMQKNVTKAVQNRQTLEGQLSENVQVQVEFKLLKDDSAIYKLIGPVLVKQDGSEAVLNVTKRIEWIRGELKRSEEMIADLQAKMEKKKIQVVEMETALNRGVTA